MQFGVQTSDKNLPSSISGISLVTSGSSPTEKNTYFSF